MTEPTTEAGRALHDRQHKTGRGKFHSRPEPCTLVDDILAIEAEARATLDVERLADALRKHRYGSDSEGIYSAWCACGQWDDDGEMEWAEHAAAILAALTEDA